VAATVPLPAGAVILNWLSETTVTAVPAVTPKRTTVAPLNRYRSAWRCYRRSSGPDSA
jgi:hypothetical protein